MPNISVVIITLNEERNIGRCITSVKPFADEIILVDSFSSDRTAAIAEELGAKVVQQKFLGYIQQKNFAKEQASNHHILSLDADEEVSPELCESIIAVKNNFIADAYTMNRMTNYCGKWIKHSGWYPDKKLRLFDSRKGSWKGTNPHDKYELTSKNKIKHLKGNLNHYSYYAVSEHLKQIDKFSEIAAKAMFAKGEKSSPLKVFISPCFKFIRNYFLKLGFLDGYYGYLICRITAFETFLKYARLWKLQRTGKLD